MLLSQSYSTLSATSLGLQVRNVTNERHSKHEAVVQSAAVFVEFHGESFPLDASMRLLALLPITNPADIGSRLDFAGDLWCAHHAFVVGNDSCELNLTLLFHKHDASRLKAVSHRILRINHLWRPGTAFVTEVCSNDSRRGSECLFVD